MNKGLIGKLLTLLALLALFGGSLSSAFADEPPPEASVNGKYSNLLKVIDCPRDEASYGQFKDYGEYPAAKWCDDDAPAGHWVYVAPKWYIWGSAGAATPPAGALTEKELDYVMLAGTVACYNIRVTDAAKASAAIDAYLESEGLKKEEYMALEKEHAGKPAVRAAIKEEMELCPTRMLPGAEEAAVEEPEPSVEDIDCKKTPDHELCKIDCKKTPDHIKCQFNYATRVYMGTYSANGVTGGTITVSMGKDGKLAIANIGGKTGTTPFNISLRGNRDKTNLRLSGTGKNSGTITSTLNKKELKGSFSGTANGRNLSFSFTARTK
jgi:hypothetical protein